MPSCNGQLYYGWTWWGCAFCGQARGATIIRQGGGLEDFFLPNFFFRSKLEPNFFFRIYREPDYFFREIWRQIYFFSTYIFFIPQPRSSIKHMYMYLTVLSRCGLTFCFSSVGQIIFLATNQIQIFFSTHSLGQIFLGVKIGARLFFQKIFHPHPPVF